MGKGNYHVSALFILALILGTFLSCSSAATCPIDAVKLRACVDVLGGLIHIGIGQSIRAQCCPLLTGLVDLDAQACVCTTIRANLLGIIHLDLPLALSLLVNTCQNQLPSEFRCPA